MPMNPRLLRPRASGRFLLDLHGPAEFAYSLRRLRSGHSGPVVRVRRSNDSNEADFNADEVANGTLASWVGAGNNGLVTTWYDQSGNGFNVVQAVSGNQPTIVSSGSLVTDGSTPAISFGGGQQQLLISRSYSADRHHVFAVCRNTSTAASARYVWSAGPERAVNRINTGINAQFYQQNSASFLIATGSSFYTQDARLLVSVFANHTLGSISVFKNGASSTSNSGGNTSAVSATSLGVGGTPGASTGWVGQISEVVAFLSDVSGSRTLIESEINRHYAIY